MEKINSNQSGGMLELTPVTAAMFLKNVVDNLQVDDRALLQYHVSTRSFFEIQLATRESSVAFGRIVEKRAFIDCIAQINTINCVERCMTPLYGIGSPSRATDCTSFHGMERLLARVCVRHAANHGTIHDEVD